MTKLKNFLKATEIAAGTGMFLLDQANRHASRRVRSKLSDSVDDWRDRAKDAYDVVADRVSGMTHRRNDHEGLWNVVRFAVGLGIGIGVGLLVAPANGEETRSRIADKAQEIGGNMRQRFNQEGQRFSDQAGLRATGTGN